MDKQRELAGWFKPFASSSYQYKPVLLPNDQSNLQIDLKPNEFKYVITKQLSLQLGETVQSKITFQVIHNIKFNKIIFYTFKIILVYKNQLCHWDSNVKYSS